MKQASRAEAENAKVEGQVIGVAVKAGMELPPGRKRDKLMMIAQRCALFLRAGNRKKAKWWYQRLDNL